MALCAFINRLGLDASNGYGIAQKIQSFIMLIPGSIMQCMASFVAQNVGAGKEDRAKKGMLYGMAVGAGIGVIIALVAFFKGDVLASIFSNNPQDIARAFSIHMIILFIIYFYILIQQYGLVIIHFVLVGHQCQPAKQHFFLTGVFVSFKRPFPSFRIFTGKALFPNDIIRIGQIERTSSFF